MSRDISVQLEEINQQIDAARKRYTELEHALEKNQQLLNKSQATENLYSTLAKILENINTLEKLGGSSLLWGEKFSHTQATENKQRITSTLQEYEQQLDKTQKQKIVLGQQLARIESSINALLSRRHDLLEEIHARKAEFVIEREIKQLPTRLTILPWSNQHNDIVRLRAVMLTTLSIAILMGYIIPRWELPEPERIEFIEIPERLVSMVVKKAPPPEPVVEQKPQEEIEAEDDPEDKPADEEKEINDARKAAEKTGLLAFREDFADIIDASSNIKLGAQAAISKKMPVRNRNSSGRSLVTSQVQLSGSDTGATSIQRTNVNTDNNLRKVAFSHVESQINRDQEGEPQDSQESAKPVRSDEEIQVVFDRYKDALYRIYNRELRKNSLLRGKLVLRLTIEPSGMVSKCIIDSSSLNTPELEEKIVARVLRFNFSKKQGASSLTILYPIDFLPAS